MDFKTIALLGGAYWFLKNKSAASAAAQQMQTLLAPSTIPVAAPPSVGIGAALPSIVTGLATALGQPIPSQSTSALK